MPLQDCDSERKQAFDTKTLMRVRESGEVSLPDKIDLQQELNRLEMASKAGSEKHRLAQTAEERVINPGDTCTVYLHPTGIW